MIFKVVEHRAHIDPQSPPFVGLGWDDWNDYSYCTLFQAFYFAEGEKNSLGGVRIAFVGQQKRVRALSMNESFEQIPVNYFSLGVEEYYNNLHKFNEDLRDEILAGLNDIAKFPEIFEYAIKEEVTRVSLLRFTSVETVIGQFRRLASGGARLTTYNFSYLSPSNSTSSKYELNFQVVPESFPPTNIHVLIGRNGVGKTTLLNNMINSLIVHSTNPKDTGSFNYQTNTRTSQFFANLISVSFSAFDDSILPSSNNERNDLGLKYSYIGLKKRNLKKPNVYDPMTTQDLCNEFVGSLKNIKISSRTAKWKNCIKTLENDPNFQESRIPGLIGMDGEEFVSEANRKFKQLSSGHKVVLLTITRLVELLEEKSLVLIDEPESHLHPPLLSSFTRALSELLIFTNGVAIIATHSPVVLQEVPKSCVWKLRRSGEEAVAERLAIESFGENVGTLTSEVFGLEVKKSGYFSLLHSIYNAERSYEGVLKFFGNQLGMEAKAIVRVMEIEDQENEEN